MKKGLLFFVLLVFFLVISLVACGESGGTLQVLNDTPNPHPITIIVEGSTVYNALISPSQTISHSSGSDFSYQILSNGVSLGYGTMRGGETYVMRLSTTLIGRN